MSEHDLAHRVAVAEAVEAMRDRGGFYVTIAGGGQRQVFAEKVYAGRSAWVEPRDVSDVVSHIDQHEWIETSDGRVRCSAIIEVFEFAPDSYTDQELADLRVPGGHPFDAAIRGPLPRRYSL